MAVIIHMAVPDGVCTDSTTPIRLSVTKTWGEMVGTIDLTATSPIGVVYVIVDTGVLQPGFTGWLRFNGVAAGFRTDLEIERPEWMGTGEFWTFEVV